MIEEILVGFAIILLLGIVSQWVAWAVHIPSILLLLVSGFLAGPVLGILDPDAIMGDLMFPVVSVSVAIILFEGGLSLRLDQIPGVRSVIFRLISIGVLATWLIASLASMWLLPFDYKLSILIGAILTVSGPTVVLPLLRFIHPRKPLGEILKWEGILIDPVGALFAVLVFEAIMANVFGSAPIYIAIGVGQTILVGGVGGAIGAAIIIVIFRRHLLPDYLHNPFTLMLVVSIYVISNHFHAESGLLSVTLMAIILANRKDIEIDHLLEFKENLSVLIISSLFILLAARIRLEKIAEIEWGKSLLFLAIILFVARPVSVWVSTLGSNLNLRQKVFLSWLAPRGIVAAAVASIFSFELIASGHEEAELLVSYTFFVIVGTVAVYGLTAGPLARLLDVAQEKPQGILFLGANRLGRAMAVALQEANVRVLLVDTSRANSLAASREGLSVVTGNPLHESVLNSLDLDDIGRLVAVTPNHEVNALATVRFAELFGRNEVYQLASADSESVEDGTKNYATRIRGRLLFDNQLDFFRMAETLDNGARVAVVKIDKPFTLETFREQYGKRAVPLFLIPERGVVEVFTTDRKLIPEPGQKLIAMIKPVSV